MHRQAVRAVLAAASLAALGLGATAAAQEAEPQGTDNLALISQDATDAVLKRTEQACEALFSFNYRVPDVHDEAVAEYSTAEARDELEALAGLAHEQGSSTKLVTTSTVQYSAVRQLTPERATVLVFLRNESSASGGERRSATSALRVTLIRHDGRWLVAGVELPVVPG